MKLKLLLAGVLCTLAITGGKAHAESLPFAIDKNMNDVLTAQSITPLNLEVKKEKPKEVKKVEVPPPVEYTILEGDSLEKIAKDHSIVWKRIWDKNPNITNPDMINTDDKVVIPREDEVLADRPLPVQVQVDPVQAKAAPTGPAAPVARGPVSNNLYDPGYCTWYVKNRRPDLPNSLGNADTWYYRAQALGLPTGTTPAAGAAAQVRGQMHVVYVESVNGDGTIVISEMNYAGLYSLRTVTVNASNYLYIY